MAMKVYICLCRINYWIVLILLLWYVFEVAFEISVPQFFILKTTCNYVYKTGRLEPLTKPIFLVLIWTKLIRSISYINYLYSSLLIMRVAKSTTPSDYNVSTLLIKRNKHSSYFPTSMMNIIYIAINKCIRKGGHKQLRC